MTLKIFMPIAFLVVFIGWVLYRLVIKKDLKQNLNSLYAGLFFVGVWALLYFFVFR